MKRLLFAVFALFIMAGYMFAQNEAYVQQVGPSAVYVNQSGSLNKVTGDGIAFTNAAAYLQNTLGSQAYFIQNGTENTISLHQVAGTFQTAVIAQYGTDNTATLKQTAAGYNGLYVSQSGYADATLEQTATTGVNYTVTNQVGGSSSAHNTFDLKMTASGSNGITPSGTFSVAGVGDAGIYQNGQGNVIHGTTPDAYNYAADDASKKGIQNATAGSNHFAAIQTGNTNLIGVSQLSTDGNEFDVYQFGNANRMFIDQSGLSNSAKVQMSGNQNLSVHQIGAGTNTVVVSM